MSTPALYEPLTRTEDHRYFMGERELPGVTRILSEARLSNFSAPWFTPEVKARGQAVHATIALEIEGVLDEETLDPVLVPYLDGWRRYGHEKGATVEHSERMVCDPAAGYAGTLDLIVMEPEHQRGPLTRRTVLDVKPALYPSVGPQVAAYTRCARSLYDRPVLFQRAALVLPGDGSYRREPLTDSTDEYTFLAALRLFHWRSSHGCL